MREDEVIVANEQEDDHHSQTETNEKDDNKSHHSQTEMIDKLNLGRIKHNPSININNGKHTIE
jgi:hypothetical protein